MVGYNHGTISNSYSSGSVNGHSYVGGLVGINNNGTISNSYATGSVNGHSYVGGLVGINNNGTISNSYATGSVNGNSDVGGLVGYNDRTISNSYATGSVNGDYSIGGLVGYNYHGIISSSYATGSVVGTDFLGGFVGYNWYGTITNSYASGTVTRLSGSDTNFGGLLGYANFETITNSFYDKETNTASMNDSSYGKTKAEILSSFSNLTGWGTTGGGASVSGYEVVLLPYLIGVTKDEDKSKSILFSGGSGTEVNPYTITNWTQLQNINNSNIVSSSYYFNLLNNINSSTTGYMGNSGEGWNPIGDYTNNFNGRFDGLGFTISNLYINRPSQNYVGLFGYTNNATIKNIGLKDVDISGRNSTGGLVGFNENGTISNSYSSGSVTGTNYVGGLVGYKWDGTISNSYASGNVNGNSNVGGLVGYMNNYFFNVTISNSYASGSVTGTNHVGGLVGYNNFGTILDSFYDKTKNPNSNLLGIGKTTAELEDINTFQNAGWSITADTALVKGTPILKNGSWIIGTYIAPTPTPNPTPNPTPTDNNQKPKVDEQVQRVIASIEPSTNSNSSSNQSVPNSLNSNIKTLSFNGVDETRVINGGVKMPENIANEEDIIK
ncbi:hypothetical protein NG750_03495 [Aliarcobacter cryaerophilus]